MKFQEYLARVDKLTKAVAAWIYRTNPNEDTVKRVFERTQYTISKWWNEIVKE